MATESAAVEFTVFGKILSISPGRVEYNRLRSRFRELAKEQTASARDDIGRFAANPEPLLRDGASWAKPFIVKAADLAVEELMQKGCLDLDTEEYLKSKFDFSPWDLSFKPAHDEYLALVQAEEQREAERAERTEDAGESWAGGGFGLGGAIKGALEAEALNIASAAISEGFNKLGRNRSQKENAAKMLDIFARRQDEIVQGVYAAIANGADALVACCNERSIPIEGAVSADDVAKADRMSNNLKTGKIPVAMLADAKVNILGLNPYCRDFYDYVFMTEGDASGELEKVGAYFGISFDDRKKDAFIARLGECAYDNEAQVREYRTKALALAEELKYDPVEKISEIDRKLAELETQARTVEGREFPDRETAGKHRELCALETSQDLSSEETALRAKKLIEEKAKELGVDFSWRMERIQTALARFDAEAKTVDGRVFETREIAAKQRELAAFERGLDVSTESVAIGSKNALAAKIAELGVDGDWKKDRVESAVKRFERTACVAFGKAYATREEAAAARAIADRFYEGVELILRQCNHRSVLVGAAISSKKATGVIVNFGIVAGERILGLVDTSLFGNCKSGMAFTTAGLRWKNGAIPTAGNYIPWTMLAESERLPTPVGKCVDFGNGKMFENGGLLSAPMDVIVMALHRAVGFCLEATCLGA